MIAPFWADVDTRPRGEGVESGEIHVDIGPGRRLHLGHLG